MTLRRAAIILHDLAMTPLALGAAYFLRAGGVGDFVTIAIDLPLLALVLTPLAGLVYRIFGLYRGVWRFASQPDLFNILRATTILALALVAVDFLAGDALLVPRTAPTIFWLVLTLFLVGPRLAYRALRDHRRRRRIRSPCPRIPVLVAGTGIEAERILRSLETRHDEPLAAVGLLARKHGHVGERIRNVPVLGRYADLEHVVESLRRSGQPPRRLVFTREALSDSAIRDDLLRAAQALGLTPVRAQGRLTDLDRNGQTKFTLAPIAIEDLLGRDVYDLDLTPVAHLIRGRRVLVTGAGGSIGSELVRQISGMSPDLLILIENSEQALHAVTLAARMTNPALEVAPLYCDIRDAMAIERAFTSLKPELVFHAAALKHVDIVERHPVEGARTNALGARLVADAALAHDALAFVYVSTDKAVNPVSALGATKRAGELWCRRRDAESAASGRTTRFLTVRFGNVLGASGSVVPLFKEQLALGGPLTVTDPQAERHFMTVGEAVTLLLMATALGLDRTGPRRAIYVLDMGRPVKIADLAAQMIRLAGFTPGRDVAVTFTGLRPGERLREEIRSPGETLQMTPVRGILAAETTPIDPSRIEAGFSRLSTATAAGDECAVRAALDALVIEEVPMEPIGRAMQTHAGYR